MKQISSWMLVFTILSLVFIILLVFLRFPLPIYPLMSYQDVLDLLTPLVLIPIYGVLLRKIASDAPSHAESIAFLVLSALWVEGQGIHLAANSISNLMAALAREAVIDVSGTDLYRLTYFFDEHLGHYMWHIGVLGLAALLIYREWRSPAGQTTVWWSTILAGVIYGFFLFAITNEGQTVPMGLPFSFLVTFLSLVWGRKILRQRPVLAFFFVACLLAFLFYVGWGLYWGGFPGFFDTGIMG